MENYLDFLGKIIQSPQWWFAFASVLRAGCEQEEITYLVCNVNVLVFIAYMARKTVPTGSPCQWLCTSAVLEIKCFGVHALCIFPYLLRGCYHWYIRRPSHYLLLKSLLFKKEIIWSFRGKITQSPEWCFAFGSVLGAGCQQEDTTHLVCNVSVLVFMVYMTDEAVPTGPPCQSWKSNIFGVHALSVFFLNLFARGKLFFFPLEILSVNKSRSCLKCRLSWLFFPPLFSARER